MLVGGLSLSLSLRPSNCHEPYLNTIVSVIALYVISVEFLFVIEDYCLRHSKPSDDVFPYELANHFLSGRCYYFFFHPLNEVVDIPQIEICIAQLSLGNSPKCSCPT